MNTSLETITADPTGLSDSDLDGALRSSLAGLPNPDYDEALVLLACVKSLCTAGRSVVATPHAKLIFSRALSGNGVTRDELVALRRIAIDVAQYLDEGRTFWLSRHATLGATMTPGAHLEDLALNGGLIDAIRDAQHA